MPIRKEQIVARAVGAGGLGLRSHAVILNEVKNLTVGP